jgi:hypothetical protein
MVNLDRLIVNWHGHTPITTSASRVSSALGSSLKLQRAGANAPAFIPHSMGCLSRLQASNTLGKRGVVGDLADGGEDFIVTPLGVALVGVNFIFQRLYAI